MLLAAVGIVTSFVSPADPVEQLSRDVLVVPRNTTIAISGPPLVAVDGDVAIFGNVSATNPLTITSGNDVVIDGNLTGGAGDLIVQAASDILVRGTIIAGSGDVVLRADGDIELQGVIIGGQGNGLGASGL